jgi:hypothetical protein
MLKRVVIILAMLALYIGASGATEAFAAPTPANGTFDNTVTYTGARSADGNTILPFTFVERIEGTFTGTRVGTGTLILHPDGTLNVHNSGVFTGTVAGSAPGTLILRAEASGTLSAVTGHFDGTIGTGGLSGITAHGSVAGAAVSQIEFVGTYSGQVESGGTS